MASLMAKLSSLNCFKNKRGLKSPDARTVAGNGNGNIGTIHNSRNIMTNSTIEISKTSTNLPDPTTSTPVQAQPSAKPVLKVQIRKPTLPEVDSCSAIPTSPSSQHLLATPERSGRNSQDSSDSPSHSNSPSTSRHWLKEQLYAARLECPRRAHCFVVPRSDQEKLITVATVTKDIQDRSPDIDEQTAVEYAEKACETSRQLYATLAYTKNGADICSLLDEGITDADLPFVRKPNAPKRFALYRHNGEPIKTLETWKNQLLEKFDRSQWWFIAPVFRLNQDLYNLDDNTILPFVPVELCGDDLDPKHGGYSEVYPVRIHPAHHEFWDGTGRQEDEPLVAVKRLFNSDKTEFLKEATILKAVNLKDHPHLIKLLATYKYEGKYHLMFPYANANLRKYWDDRPAPIFDRATVLWSLKQMTGIAHGLLRVHNFKVTHPLRATKGAGGVRMTKHVKLEVENGEEWYGRHGDIKPENILWFEQDRGTQDPRGILQIADFGLGRFHGRDSRSKVKPEDIQTSPTYEPPECQLRMPVSRAYDIWGLGCLYLEFVTWLIMGSVEIEGFSNFRGRVATGTGIDDDNFFTIINSGSGQYAVVRQAVLEWKDKLHKHERCSQLIHDLLDLIMKDLLVTESSDRCTASWLVQQLNTILLKAKDDDGYLLVPTPYVPKPATDRSHSTPAPASISNTKKKNKATAGTEVPRSPPVKKIIFAQPSKDLVQRIPGTPGLRPHTNQTWPIGLCKEPSPKE